MTIGTLHKEEGLFFKGNTSSRISCIYKRKSSWLLFGCIRGVCYIDTQYILLTYCSFSYFHFRCFKNFCSDYFSRIAFSYLFYMATSDGQFESMKVGVAIIATQDP